MQTIKGFMDGLRPDPILTVTEWADTYRMLSSVSSAEPGKYRSSRTPFIKKIMDALSAHSTYEIIVFMKGAQLGATEGANNWIGYIMSMVPGPVMMVQPTRDTVKRNSKVRIDPMIESTPILREKVKKSRSRDSGNTTFMKEFVGGILVMAGANSAADLRSMPVRFLLLDETDAYPIDLDGEGSPIDLAIARTRTFAKKKILLISTPKTHGSSVIENEFLKTDQNWFQVPCPHCSALQKLLFVNLIWEKGKPETAKFKCVHCSELIEEKHKPFMLDHGDFIPDFPDRVSKKKIGFFVNSFYSPLGWYSWEEAARDYEAAENDIEKLKTFTNTVLGETWKEKGEQPPWENLFNRRELYPFNKPPVQVCFITVGVDVQKDRIELEVVGWAKGKRSYSIDYRVLPGDTSDVKVWNELALVVNETWIRSDGVELPMRRMAVDTGWNTNAVYDFCRRFDISKVIPVKGQDTQAVILAAPRAVDVKNSGKKINKFKVWNVGVSLLKSELYGWLRQEKAEDGMAPAGYCFFPQYDNIFFKGITAEQLEFKKIRGFKRGQWVKKYERNEPLDCRNYARAAATAVGIDRFKDEHYDAIAGTIIKAAPPKPKKDDDEFWGREKEFW